jgi:hypothetical protein
MQISSKKSRKTNGREMQRKGSAVQTAVFEELSISQVMKLLSTEEQRRAD